MYQIYFFPNFAQPYAENLKSFIPIVLLSAVFLQPLQSFWVRISFELNKTYIAKNLCENRFKPELQCGGKCYLMKKLAEKQKQEKETQKERSESFSFVSYNQELPTFLFNQAFVEISNKQLGYYLELAFAQEYLFDIFHPPRL